MARYIAKNIVATGLAEKCEIQLSYAIGVAEPTSVMVTTFGTGVETTKPMDEIVRENFKLTPDGIIETLNLRNTNYKPTAMYGHFGIEGLLWEQTDKVDDLKNTSNRNFEFKVSTFFYFILLLMSKKLVNDCLTCIYFKTRYLQ